VYVHVPFCRRRCDYCAFATWTDRHHLMAAYAAACRTEIVTASLPPATSVYVGGGTPSLLGGPLLASVLDAVERAPGCEVTVECNPEDVTTSLLRTYRRAGVTRISLGVQSMVPAVLAGLGRDHGGGPQAVRRAVARCGEAGLGTFNVDLIFGAAAETGDDWERTVDEVLALEPSPPHVSAYALTVEPGTPLARDPARHPDDDVQADRYLAVDARLRAAGLEAYEISNWARPGHECRHNLLYWSQGDYRGIGCAAHSHRSAGADGPGRRWWNVRTPERYISLVDGGRPATAGDELLDAATTRREGLQLALRTSAGVPADALPDVGGAADRELAGLVWRRRGRVGLTPRGRLLANEVAVRLR
jgi:oxygen-independent coproporphyrinogen-3 oxidase